MKVSNKIGLGLIVMFVTAFFLSILTNYTSFYTNGIDTIIWSAIMGAGVGLAADLNY